MSKIETRLSIKEMDCPSEEQMVRMALDQFDKIESINVNLDKREVTVIHQEDSKELYKTVDKLNLDSTLISEVEVGDEYNGVVNSTVQRFILAQVLLINLSFFIIEELAGYLFNSVGLSADGLDMLADSLVYLLALLSIGKSMTTKKMVSAFAGYFQIFLALLGFGQVIYRFINHDYLPHSLGMLIIAVMALLANIVSYFILSKTNQEEVHMKASKIFTSNDILINLGLIFSSLLVYILHSPSPDLIIGTLIFAFVLKGAFKILALSK